MAHHIKKVKPPKYKNRENFHKQMKRISKNDEVIQRLKSYKTE